MEIKNEEKMLNALEDIASTLKRIEQKVSRPLNGKEMFEESLKSAKDVGKMAFTDC